MKKANFVLYFRAISESFLEQALLSAIRFDMTFATYYAKKRGESKPHRVAITHMVKRLI